uniref:RNA-directed DNA polymerase, eukaryota, reverse transcriptase zinc-binding domain protein n=1 Tax=Tanacetum cinerariifolium TaxID=118510 RepID=A0A6L2NXE1_TANCI|nr:RNA-directed DNA polymerase, eukaryota, reverse transcriptase zinc-binding domain protein [Tanacetum cinerariifolium]
MLKRYFGVARRSKDGSGPELAASVLVRLVKWQGVRHQDHNSMWCQEDQTRTITARGVMRTRLANKEELGDEGATTASERVEDETHSYFELRPPDVLEARSRKQNPPQGVEEMQSMKDNEVWKLVDLPPDGKTVSHKWLFKKKIDMDGAVHTYKACLVAKDYEIWQMDVKITFLNGYLNEEVYMEQPEGFVSQKFSNRVCKLKRSIYGLKQASRQWNKRFDNEIEKFEFSQNRDEPCVYVKASRSYVTFLILYVDDILIMGNNIPMLQDVKSYLERCFAMKDLGESALDMYLFYMEALLTGKVKSKWDGEVVITGDFNEVRFKSERFGSVFNVQGANVFNAFFANAGLEEEWLNDNRNKSKSVSDQFKEELQKLDANIDKGIGSDDIVNKRLEVLNSIQHLDKIQAMDMAQKAKIKWAIEGGENTRQFWSSIENDVFAAVSHFFTFGDIPNGCNSSFIALIPKVPDANFVKDFRPISLIGSMYKIIAKILANRLVGVLGDIVNEVQSDFITKRQILDGPFILNEVIQWSLRGSIIINGSPTEEFQFFKRLKQGDTLSPFLFILIMESLHLSFQRVVDVGMFKGINLSPLVNLSHMFYADDAVFVRQWCDESIRCHFFNGHELNSNKASWVKWKSVLASKEKGGLGVSSVYALNRALMMKWVWRFYSKKESLWARVIKAIYGDDGQVGKVFKADNRSCWRNIVNEVRVLSNQGIKVLDYMRIKLGNEESTAFWNDNWIGGKVLKYSFPRIYALETQKEVTANSKISDTKLENSLRRSIRGGVEHVQFNELSDMLQSVSLMPYSDRWVWSLEGSGEFSVASIRKIIDDNRLSTVDTRTLWIKCVPIKVNVLS